MSSYDRIFCSSASLISNRRLYAGGTKHLVGCIESSSSGEGRGGGCKGMRSNYKTSCKQKKSLSASFALFVLLLHCIPYSLLTIGLRLTLYNTSLPTLTEKTMSHDDS